MTRPGRPRKRPRNSGPGPWVGFNSLEELVRKGLEGDGYPVGKQPHLHFNVCASKNGKVRDIINRLLASREAEKVKVNTGKKIQYYIRLT